jgi:hypothetical protein
MLLYHFTAANRLDAIMAEGLTIGDVPVDGPTAPGLNAVWLTTSKESDEHGLGEPREMTDLERENIRQWKGILPQLERAGTTNGRSGLLSKSPLVIVH